jgi:hypothetical protein
VHALEGAFTAAVQKAVGRHPSRAARHCGIHRAQWWRLAHAENATSASDIAPTEADDAKSGE